MKINNLGLFRDEEGKTYEVLERVKQKVIRPIKGSPTTLDGVKDYETSCGIPVNVKKDGVFVTWENVVLTPMD